MTLLVCSLPQLRSQLRNRNERVAANNTNAYDEYNFTSFIIFFAFTGANWLLNCWADKEPLELKYPKSEKPCPESAASFLSRLFFTWFDALALKGYRNPLEHKDLWDMNVEDSSKEIMPLFMKHWNKSVAKAAGTDP